MPETLDLLKRLMNFPQLKTFALVGGTNLSLQLGHRLSIDLDIFANTTFFSDDILPIFNEEFGDIIVINQTKKSFSAIIEQVKVDIVLHEYPYLQPIIELDGIRMLSIPDIIAMKLGAMAQRGAKKDFWDIAALLDFYTLEEMLNFFEKKYANNDYGYVIHALYYFVDADIQNDPIDLKGITWQDIKIKIKKATDNYIKNRI